MAAHLQRGKVNHTVNVRVVGENGVQSLLVCDIDLVEFRFLPTDELYSVDDFLGGVVKVVNYDDFVVRFEEREGRKRANVACAAVFSQSGPGLVPEALAYPVIRHDPTGMVKWFTDRRGVVNLGGAEK